MKKAKVVFTTMRDLGSDSAVAKLVGSVEGQFNTYEAAEAAIIDQLVNNDSFSSHVNSAGLTDLRHPSYWIKKSYQLDG